MKSRAAVLWNVGEKWSVEELEVAPPAQGEVTIRVRATGLCHSDDHNVTGDFAAPLPLVGGHEATGEVIEVGPGVTRLKAGDRVITFPMPSCGECRYCSKGRGWLCDLSRYTMTGSAPGNRYRFSRGDVGVGAFCQLGTFSEYATISAAQAFQLPDDIPWEPAALVGCGVSTGFGAATRTGRVAPGDNVVVVGVGGVGMAAVQGARVAGAASVLVIDPVAYKREASLRFGATHAVATVEEAMPLLSTLSWGAMSEVVIVTVGVMHTDWFAAMAELVGKGGKLVMTSVTPLAETAVSFALSPFAMSGKSLVGNLAGSTNPISDFDEMWRLYRAGRVDLENLITKRYTLDQVNDGYEDMHAGDTIRGLITFD
jgi:S-(hydroxymethyl)glutathione dehydrogenase/alcohol dehydrogenase